MNSYMFRLRHFHAHIVFWFKNWRNKNLLITYIASDISDNTVNNFRKKNKNSKRIKYKELIRFFLHINQSYSFKEYNVYSILELI
jgi:hypothetical protein